MLVDVGHRVDPLQLRLQLADLLLYKGKLHLRQGHRDIARIRFAVQPQCFHGQFADQGLAGEVDAGVADLLDPTGARDGAGRAAGFGHRGAHGHVQGMLARLGADRVEHRPGEYRRLDRKLQRLPLDYPLWTVHIGLNPGRGRLGYPVAVHRPLYRLDVHAEVPGEPAGVLRTQRPVLDLRDEWRGGPERVDPTLGGIEVVPGQDRAQREGDQRFPARDQIPYRRLAFGHSQLAGVHVVRAHGDEGLGHEPLVVLEGPQRGLLPGRITVEGEDDLAAERVGVHQQPA